MTGGLLTLRFALAIRPRPGFRLGLAAAIAAVVGAVLVLLRDQLSGLIDPYVLIGLLGIAAVLTGLLRIAEGAVVTGTGRRAR
jgi:asparagine N-glycosylation enzyme membrane subunit Stt3